MTYQTLTSNYRKALSSNSNNKTYSVKPTNLKKANSPLTKCATTVKLLAGCSMFCLLFFLLCLSTDTLTVFATTRDSGVEQLSNLISDNLNKIDFTELNNLTNGLDGSFNFFGNDSFATRVGKILSGEFISDYPNIMVALLALFGGTVLDVLPIVVLIVAIAVLCGFMNSMRSDSSGKGVADIVYFVCLSAIIIITLAVVVDLTRMTSDVLHSIKRQIDIIFPILLTLMAAVGGTVSAGVYQPAVAVLSGGVVQIFSSIIMPLFFITLVFSIVGNLSPSIKLDRFVGFFTSLFKWLVGIIFTVFFAFLAVQGITAATHDGVSIRAAKLTISSYVPYLGGYVSQGFDLVLASSILIKNAVGVAGLYLLFGIVLGPIIKIAVFMLALKLAAAITQPIADARISNFLTAVQKSFGMLVACLIGVAFMYFLTLGLVICSANFI